MPRFIFALSVLLLIPVNVMAIEINDEGADRLKNSLQKLLDYQKTANEAFGDLHVIYDGDLNVTKEAQYYVVTLPHISIKSTEETDNFNLDIGVITLNMMQDDKPKYWKTTLSFPDKITVSDNTDEDLIIEWKNQNAIALFNETLGYFTKFDVNMSDISSTDGGKDTGFNIGGIKLYSNLDEEDNSKFSGSGNVTFSNVSIAPPDNGGSIKLGEVKFDFNILSLTLLKLEEYSAKLLKHADTFKSLSKLEAEDEEDTSNINSDNVVDMILDLYEVEMDGFNFNYSFKDFEVNSNPNDKDKEFDNIKIGSAFVGFGFDGLNSEKGSINIKTGYNKIQVTPADPEYSDLLPQNANFNIKATSIPYSMLSEIGVSTAKIIVKDPDRASMAGIGVLMRLPAILSQANTQITLENNGIKNDIYDLNLNGSAVTDLTAMMSFSAKFTAIFKGLDRLLSISNKYAANTESTNADNFTNMSKTLEKLKEIGKSENGEDSYSFEFKTTPEGQFLLNGKDASTISFQ